jgi:hypothetical protein
VTARQRRGTQREIKGVVSDLRNQPIQIKRGLQCRVSTPSPRFQIVRDNNQPPVPASKTQSCYLHRLVLLSDPSLGSKILGEPLLAAREARLFPALLPPAKANDQGHRRNRPENHIAHVISPLRIRQISSPATSSSQYNHPATGLPLRRILSGVAENASRT